MLYEVGFATLALLSAVLSCYRHQNKKHRSAKDSITLPKEDILQDISEFKWQYFGPVSRDIGLLLCRPMLTSRRVSISVRFRDGRGRVAGKIRAMIERIESALLIVRTRSTQGAYLYTLYRDEKNMPESTVAALFTSGFVAAAITASFIGSFADQYGRRSACLLHCMTCAMSCLSVLSDDPLLLFAGRVLGGFSTTLLYSVFESWMVAEYHRRELKRCLALGDLFSFSVTLSCILAILAGVAGDALVEFSGTKTSPVGIAQIDLTSTTAIRNVN